MQKHENMDFFDFLLEFQASEKPAEMQKLCFFTFSPPSEKTSEDKTNIVGFLVVLVILEL